MKPIKKSIYSPVFFNESRGFLAALVANVAKPKIHVLYLTVDLKQNIRE